MSRYEKRAKCPKCLPDIAGAYFKADGTTEWVCTNCGHRMPRRVNNPVPTVTPSQERVLVRLRSFGWAIETKMIGRSVWVTGSKDRGSVGMNLIAGDSIYGKIGPRGSFEIKLQRLGADKVLTDDIGLEVYLK